MTRMVKEKVERRERGRKEDKTEDDKFIKEKGKVMKDKENNKVNNKLKRTGPVSSLKNGNVKRKRLTH